MRKYLSSFISFLLRRVFTQKSKNRLIHFKLVIALAMLSPLLFFYVNCEDSYKISSEAPSLEGYNAPPSLVITNPIIRTETIVANEEEAQRPRIDVNTILDNSYSMEPIQQKVKDAFNNITSRLKGFSGQVSLHTTTQDLLSNSSDYQSSVVAENVLRYTDAQGSLVEIPTTELSQISSNTNYSKIKKFQLPAPFTVSGAPLAYDANMDNGVFQNFVNDYTSSIGGIGTGGSDREQPLCTLLRIIEANKNANAFQAFVIATNEDDQTTPADCLLEISKDVKKVQSQTTLSRACKTGEEALCNYKYQINFKGITKQKLNYSNRSVVENINYQAKQPNVTQYTTNGSWYQSRTEATYQVQQRQQTLYFQKNIVRDGLRIPQTKSDGTPLISSYSLATETGACQQETSGINLSCQDPIFSKLPADATTNGLVNGQCRYACQTSNTSTKIAALTSYVQESCASLTAAACTTTDINSVRGSTPASNIVNCQKKCVQNSNSLALNPSSLPASCTVGTLDCNSSQRQDYLTYLNGKGFNVTSTMLNSCKVTCKTSTPSGKITPSTKASTCSGMDESDNGSMGPIACTASQEQDAATARGLSLSDFQSKYSCTYDCSQSIGSRTTVLSGISACTTGTKVDCSASDRTFLGQNGVANIVSCQNECYVDTSKPACQKEFLGKSNLCADSSLASEMSSCLIGNSGYQLDLSSCKAVSSYINDLVTSYSEQEQTAINRSLLELNAGSENPVISSVAKRLNTYYGDKFFIASFVYPPGDKECQPFDSSLSTGNVHKQVVDRLGIKNAKIFPLCLPDYSDALLFVLDLIVKKVSQSYVLNIDKSSEQIDKVVLVYKNNSEAILRPDQYTWGNNMITIQDDQLLTDLQEIKVDVVQASPTN